MLDFILGFVSDLVGWLTGVLPASPFQGLILGLGGDELKWLGWLNWAMPIHDMATLFSLWALVALAFAGAVFSGKILSTLWRAFV